LKKGYSFLTKGEKWLCFVGETFMEEIEVTSWLTLDALKKAAAAVETVGNLQTGHSMSVFCTIEEDYLELHYSDSAANCIRCYEDREEFEKALKERKEEVGEAPYDEEEDMDFEEDKEEEEEEEEEKEKEEKEEKENEGYEEEEEKEGKSEKY
jgi:Pyruvate/2-oxoacid:ferredoxin oxidoreductase gamma subunit